MSELIKPNLDEISLEGSSLIASEMARSSLSETRCDKESIDAESLAREMPSHQRCGLSDARRVRRKIRPWEVGQDRITLNVGNVFFGKKAWRSELCPVHARGVTRTRLLNGELELCSSSSDVGKYIGSNVQKKKD